MADRGNVTHAGQLGRAETLKVSSWDMGRIAYPEDEFVRYYTTEKGCTDYQARRYWRDAILVSGTFGEHPISVYLQFGDVDDCNCVGGWCSVSRLREESKVLYAYYEDFHEDFFAEGKFVLDISVFCPGLVNDYRESIIRYLCGFKFPELQSNAETYDFLGVLDLFGCERAMKLHFGSTHLNRFQASKSLVSRELPIEDANRTD